MSDIGFSRGTLLKRFGNWLRSDMRVMRWALLTLYVVLVAALFLWSWVEEADRLVLLVFGTATLGCQAMIVFGAGTVRLDQPVRKRRLWVPVLAAALMFGVLAGGLSLAAWELFFLDERLGDTGAALFWGNIVANALVWFLVIFTAGRNWPRMKVLRRITGALIAGALVVLLFAGVSYLIVSPRGGFLVGLASMLGVFAATYVMLFALGPGVVLLFLRPRYRRELADGSPAMERRRFRFSLRMALLAMLVACAGAALLGSGLRRAIRNQQAMEKLEEHEARIERLGGTVAREYYGRHPDGLSKLFGDPGTSIIYSVEGAARFGDAGMRELRPLTRLRYLSLQNTQVTDAGLAHVTGFADLRNLDLRRTQVTDKGLAYVSRLTRLESLDLSGTQITDAGLAQIRRMASLQQLKLADTRVTDAGLAHLQGPGGLVELDLSGTRITDSGLQRLEQHPQLQTLCLRRCDLTNVDGLRRLVELETLHLDDCTRLENLDGLQGLTGLHTLYACGCDALADVNGLRGLTGLWWLHLSGSDALTNVDGLQGVTGLHTLALVDCDGLTNLDGLQGLIKLETLDLGGSDALTSVDGLASLIELKKLHLHHCASLSNLDGLRGLTRLESLDLSGCNGVTNFDILQGLTGLKELKLYDCDGATAATVDALRSSLPETTISF